MPEIYVDADSCPVKQEIVRVAARHGLVVHMVGNSWMRLDGESQVRRVVVGVGADAADDWIAARVGPNDIAVTQDIRLAARCLASGAHVLGPTGRPFTDDGIGMALSMRELTAHLRDSGVIRGAAPGFTRADRARFLDALERTARAALKAAG